MGQRRANPVPTVNSVRPEIIDDFQIRFKWVTKDHCPFKAALDFNHGGMSVLAAGNGRKGEQCNIREDFSDERILGRDGGRPSGTSLPNRLFSGLK